MLNNACKLTEFSLADATDEALASRGVTVAEAFRQSLDALMKHRGLKGVDLTQRYGISSATVSKLLSGDRGATFGMLEKLRVALDVSASDLFDADRALTALGLRRLPDTSASEHASQAHTSLEIARGPQVWSAPEPVIGEGATVPQDPEMFRAMAELWNGLSTANRAVLLAEASRLKKARSAGEAAS